MANLLYDSEQQRVVDRIRANAFREAMEGGAAFINRKWIANKLHRSERWVTDNWKKGYDDCYAHFSGGRPEKLSQESKDIINENSEKRRRSNSSVAKQIFQVRGKNVTSKTVGNYRARSGFKPFHVIPKPMKTALNIEDRLWFCDFLRNWDTDDFLHLAPSDEFFIWTVRRPNYQNDRVWSLCIEDIADDEHYQEISKKPDCIGVFICFTAKRMMWVIKEEGQSWNGEYFREEILTAKVIPFLKDPNNTLDATEVCFLHDKAPCFKANVTQDLLRRSGIDFFGSSEWPGASPDLNAAEHFGAILKDAVESVMIVERGPDRYSRVTLLAHLEQVLRDMEWDTDLFTNLLSSYPDRLRAVREANGGHTNF